MRFVALWMLAAALVCMTLAARSMLQPTLQARYLIAGLMLMTGAIVWTVVRK